MSQNSRRIFYNVLKGKNKKKKLCSKLGWDERNGREVAFMIIKENLEKAQGTKTLQKYLWLGISYAK